MFDIPELDEVICCQLSQHDLAQCVQVNRKWHSIVIPYLWCDLTCARFNQKALRKMVLDDYNQGQRQLRENEHDIVRHTQGRLHTSLSTLSKYGPLVRVLPHPVELLYYLRPSRSHTGLQQARTGQGNEPTKHELLRHLHKHCPIFQVQFLSLLEVDRQSDEFLKTTAEFALPRVCNLYIKSSHDSHIPFWRLKYLLDHCSSMLEKLSLDVQISNDSDDEDNKQDTDTSTHWTNFKQLALWRCEDKSDSKALWSWLWKRCGQMELLEVQGIGDIIHSLAEGMLTHMPNLNSIVFRGQSLRDEAIAAVLSTCRHGWKSVEVRACEGFGNAAKKALIKHCSTLERLVIDSCNDFTRDGIVQVLSCSPHLHTLHYDIDQTKRPPFRADMFIDQDPETRLLRAWACEASLKEFKVKITGIPRPAQRFQLDAYPGQGREIQSQVYDRLARLANLEKLWLGDIKTYSGDQFDCMEMSLTSGLHKLSGLKALKELCVFGMRTSIDVEEVIWMTEQWPGLHAIYGLAHGSRYGKAEEWMKEHHPEIRVK